MKNEVKKAVTFKPLSQIENPADLIQNPGDSMIYKVNKNGSKTLKVNAGGVKWSSTRQKTGKLHETITY